MANRTSSQHPLQSLIIKRLAELGLTYREAADRSSGLISHGRLHGLAKGRVGELRAQTIRGLSLALDVSQTSVQAAAFGGVNSPVPLRLPERSAYLSERSRAMIISIANICLEAEGLKTARGVTPHRALPGTPGELQNADL